MPTLPETGALLPVCSGGRIEVVDPKAAAWAASGAMVLTGRPAGPPLGAPPALIDLVDRAVAVLAAATRAAPLDGLALLGERAALSGLSRGGADQLWRRDAPGARRDGWLAVSLARPEDVAALPAWLGRDVSGDDPWPIVYEAAAAMSAAALDEQAALLGLPFAAVGLRGAPRAVRVRPARRGQADRGGPARVARPLGEVTVVDLSSLWAGPLCGQLLAEAGARVIKVESTGRPDGARRGPARFFDLLNGAKALGGAGPGLGRRPARPGASHWGGRRGDRERTAAGTRADGHRQQRGSRARPEGPQVWASITSHGLSPGRRQRVGFGDVAAAAGGLVAGDAQGPCFLADAVADPLTGLVTAAAVLEALGAGGRWLIDAAMAPMAAAVAGPLLDVTGLAAALPRAREGGRPAPALGADTAAVLGELVA